MTGQLTVLGPALVRRDLVKTNSKTAPTQIVLKPVTIVPNVIDLSYYSTCVIPIFAMEAVIGKYLHVISSTNRTFNGLPDILNLYNLYIELSS